MASRRLAIEMLDLHSLHADRSLLAYSHAKLGGSLILIFLSSKKFKESFVYKISKSFFLF